MSTSVTCGPRWTAPEKLEETDCPPFVKAQIRSDFLRMQEDEFHPDRMRERRGGR